MALNSVSNERTKKHLFLAEKKKQKKNVFEFVANAEKNVNGLAPNIQIQRLDLVCAGKFKYS